MSTENPGTILILETRAFPAASERAALEGYGYPVVAANTLEDAAKALSGKIVSLIACDIEFSPKTGCSAAVRTLLEGHDLPVLFLVHSLASCLPSELEELATFGFATRNSPAFVLHAAVENAMELFRLRKGT
jgi:CheY-like chemotaxis protein